MLNLLLDGGGDARRRLFRVLSVQALNLKDAGWYPGLAGSSVNSLNIFVNTPVTWWTGNKQISSRVLLSQRSDILSPICLRCLAERISLRRHQLTHPVDAIARVDISLTSLSSSLLRISAIQCKKKKRSFYIYIFLSFWNIIFIYWHLSKCTARLYRPESHSFTNYFYTHFMHRHTHTHTRVLIAVE